MRSFLGVGRHAPIVLLLGDIGWVPISLITKFSCIRFWLRLSNMSHDRLNYKIFTEPCRLAENGKTGELGFIYESLPKLPKLTPLI